MIGKKLLHYAVVEKLGEGGMGEVWRARDTSLDREVAIKVLPEAFAADPERLARFEREAKLLASLNHSGIAVLHGLHEQEGLRFLAMELVPGEDLAQRLKRGPLGIQEALFVCMQVAEALEAAHGQGVVHRDLKPANIILTPDGKAKILDFGLAKTTAAGGSSSADVTQSPTLTADHTAQGMILGTAAYMSPEQARGLPVDRRTDIWSFGCVLYECLTASGLYGGETVTDSLGAILHKEPDWSQLPAATPPTVRLLLQRCLTKDAHKRLHDIADARIELAHAIEDPEGSALGLPALSTDPIESRTGLVSRPWVAAAIALLALALGLAVGWALRPSAPEAPVRKFDLGVPLQGNRTNPDVAISPDGSQVAFSHQNLLWVQALDALEPRALEGTEGASFPFWSPDGRELGYVVGTRMFKVAAVGGRSVPIAELPAAMAGGGGASWGEDARIVLATGDRALLAVSALGGEPTVAVPLLEGEQDHHEPFVLPDGKGILFVVHMALKNPDAIQIVSGGERHEIVTLGNDSAYHPVYSPSGHILFSRVRTGEPSGLWAVPFSLDDLEVRGAPFLVVPDALMPSVSRDGTLSFIHSPRRSGLERLVWIDRNGSSLGPVGEDRRRVDDPVISPDGSRLAFSSQDENGDVDLWVRDLERGTETRLTVDSAFEFRLGWTPSGEQIVYGSFDLGSDKLDVKSVAADGSRAPRTVAERAVFMSATPDGRSALVGRARDDEPLGDNAHLDLWLVPLTGEGEPELLLDSTDPLSHGAISPNGKWLAYGADRSGETQVYLTRFPETTGRWQVSVRGGKRPYWSSDGSRLYFTEGDSLMEVTVESGGTPRLGAPVRLLELDSNLTRAPRGTTVSSDGDRFIVVEAVERDEPAPSRSGIKVVQNWSREFGR